MPESLNPICSDLQQRVKTAELSLHAAREEFKTIKSEIEAEIAGNPFWGGGREKNQQEIEIIQELKEKLRRAEKRVADSRKQLQQAEQAFRDSGLQLCGPPNSCDGDKLSDFIIEANLPNQTSYSQDLKDENARLAAEIEELTAKLKDCLYIEYPNTPRPRFDFSVLFVNNAKQVISNIERNKCLDQSSKQAIILILNNRKSYFVGGKIKSTAVRAINRINDNYGNKNQQELDLLVAGEHPKQRKIADNDRLITVYDNPDSVKNKQLTDSIRDKLRKIGKSCLSTRSPNPFNLVRNPVIKYTSTTVVTASAGPAAPAGATNVSKTLRNHGCVTLSEFQFSLDPIKAVDSLGPGGCDIKVKTQSPNNGPVVEVGSYWTYPVNVTTTISIDKDSLDKVVDCIREKIKAEFDSKREPVGGENGNGWPTITPKYTLTLTSCVSAAANQQP